MSSRQTSSEALFRVMLADLLTNFEAAKRGTPYDAMVIEGAHALLNSSEAAIDEVVVEAVRLGIANADLDQTIIEAAGVQGADRLARAITNALHDAGPHLTRRQRYVS